jgi:hypothetical protein
VASVAPWCKTAAVLHRRAAESVDKWQPGTYALDHRNRIQGSSTVRLYDFGFIIIAAGLAAAIALIVASQVG